MMNIAAASRSDSQPLRIIGHRGARGLAPENTLAAIRKGLEHDCDEIEIDVRVSRDGVVVVHHNRDLQDPTTARYDIRMHGFEELRTHKPDLATLDEAITLIDRKIPLYIEVKGGERIVPIVKVLQIFLTKGWLETDFLLGSKNQRTLCELHRALPAIPKIVIEPLSGVRAVLRARQVGAQRLSMRSWWLWSGFIRSMHRRGYRLYAYTLNDPRRARRWAACGLAGIVTDFPDRFEKSR